MRKAEDTQVKLAKQNSYPNQHYGANAKVTWFQIRDGIDNSPHAFGVHSDDDFSLYVSANEGMYACRQMVLTKEAALDFARSILIMYGEECDA